MFVLRKWLRKLFEKPNSSKDEEMVRSERSCVQEMCVKSFVRSKHPEVWTDDKC